MIIFQELWLLNIEGNLQGIYIIYWNYFTEFYKFLKSFMLFFILKEAPFFKL